MRRVEPMRARIEAAVAALEEAVKSGALRRRDVVRILEKVYRGRALQPIRGKAWPPDIWDKEMATLYAVAKYYLKLHEANPDFFHSVFAVEESLEEAGEALLTGEGEEARRLALFYLGGELSDNVVARMLRVFTTEALLGYRSLDEVEELIRRVARLLPEQERTARKFARFYIALQVAREIAEGRIRDRIAKEALKQAMAARIGLEKIIPDDEYIDFIARNVFEVPKRRLTRILKVEREGGAGG